VVERKLHCSLSNNNLVTAVVVCCSDGVAAVISGLHAIFFIIFGASLSLAETLSESVSSTVFEVNYFLLVTVCHIFLCTLWKF